MGTGDQGERSEGGLIEPDLKQMDSDFHQNDSFALPVADMREVIGAKVTTSQAFQGAGIRQRP